LLSEDLIHYNLRHNNKDSLMIQNIRIKNSHGDLLNTDFRFPENNNDKLPLLVFCHGFKGFKDWGGFPYIFDKISGAGIFSVCFNFSYNGLDNSEDNPINFNRLDLFAENTFSRELDDLGSIIDFLDKNQDSFNFDFNTLALAGHSRGGGIAILKSAEDKRIKKLITLASVSAFDRYTDERKARWRDTGYLEVLNTRTKQLMRMNYTLIEDLEKNKSRLDISSAMKRINIPSLIIHGKEDLAVDYSDAETLYDISSKESSKLLLLPNTGHTFGAVHPFAGTTEALEKVIGHIISMVKG